jgi:hypothetical protein
LELLLRRGRLVEEARDAHARLRRVVIGRLTHPHQIPVTAICTHISTSVSGGPLGAMPGEGSDDVSINRPSVRGPMGPAGAMSPSCTPGAPWPPCSSCMPTPIPTPMPMPVPACPGWRWRFGPRGLLTSPAPWPWPGTTNCWSSPWGLGSRDCGRGRRRAAAGVALLEVRPPPPPRPMPMLAPSAWPRPRPRPRPRPGMVPSSDIWAGACWCWCWRGCCCWGWCW